MTWATGRHDTPRISFRWDLPRVDPAWVILTRDLEHVRKVAGQQGVEAFIAEWRRRGHLECSDEDAAKLATLGIAAGTEVR